MGEYEILDEMLQNQGVKDKRVNELAIQELYESEKEIKKYVNNNSKKYEKKQ